MHKLDFNMNYNIPGGKLDQGPSLVAVLKGRKAYQSEYFKAAVLDWSVEWWASFTTLLPTVQSHSPLQLQAWDRMVPFLDWHQRQKGLAITPQHNIPTGVIQFPHGEWQAPNQTQKVTQQELLQA